MSDLKPCQVPSYIHYMIGGPRDGDKLPAGKHYINLDISSADDFDKFSRYVWDGEEPEPCDPGNFEMLNCTDEYAEPVWFRVNMNWVQQ